MPNKRSDGLVGKVLVGASVSEHCNLDGLGLGIRFVDDDVTLQGEKIRVSDTVEIDSKVLKLDVGLMT